MAISKITTNSVGAGTITQPLMGTNVAGNGPAFSAYQSVAQTLASGTFTKITFTSVEFDTTAGMYASSRFTPTVAGYYQVNSAVAKPSGLIEILVAIYKNGAEYKRGVDNVSYSSLVSCIVYLNGTTDYIETYCYMSTGAITWATSAGTWFQAFLARSA